MTKSEPCFAKGIKKGACSVLTGKCPGHNKCAFYKSKAQLEEEMSAATKRNKIRGVLTPKEKAVLRKTGAI